MQRLGTSALKQHGEESGGAFSCRTCPPQPSDGDRAPGLGGLGQISSLCEVFVRMGELQGETMRGNMEMSALSLAGLEIANFAVL